MIAYRVRFSSEFELLRDDERTPTSNYAWNHQDFVFVFVERRVFLLLLIDSISERKFCPIRTNPFECSRSLNEPSNRSNSFRNAPIAALRPIRCEIQRCARVAFAFRTATSESGGDFPFSPNFRFLFAKSLSKIPSAKTSGQLFGVSVGLLRDGRTSLHRLSARIASELSKHRRTNRFEHEVKNSSRFRSKEKTFFFVRRYVEIRLKPPRRDDLYDAVDLDESDR